MLRIFPKNFTSRKFFSGVFGKVVELRSLLMRQELITSTHMTGSKVQGKRERQKQLQIGISQEGGRTEMSKERYLD